MKIVEKPWGYEDIFAINHTVTVKLLHIKEKEKTSLQSHVGRDELWQVVSGEIIAVVENDRRIMNSNNKPLMIVRGQPHRIIGVSDAVVMEISYGKYSDADIKRHEDEYGRT